MEKTAIWSPLFVNNSKNKLKWFAVVEFGLFFLFDSDNFASIKAMTVRLGG